MNMHDILRYLQHLYFPVMNNLRHVLSPRFPRGNSEATLPSPQRNSAGQVACHIPRILVKKKKKVEKRWGENVPAN